MILESFLNWLMAAGIIIGIFLMIYMAYRQQGLLETVNEVKEMFEDKAEDVLDNTIYK